MRMRAEVHLSSGRVVEIMTDLETVNQATEMLRSGQLNALASNAGEHLWILAFAPGDSVVAIHAVQADEADSIVLPRAMIEGAKPEAFLIADQLEQQGWVDGTVDMLRYILSA